VKGLPWHVGSTDPRLKRENMEKQKRNRKITGRISKHMPAKNPEPKTVKIGMMAHYHPTLISEEYTAFRWS